MDRSTLSNDELIRAIAVRPPFGLAPNLAKAHKRTRGGPQRSAAATAIEEMSR